MPQNNHQYPTVEDLEKRTIRRGDCWEWTGDKSAKGYGRITRTVDGSLKTFRVHRISFEHFNGLVPDGLNVLHRCDNPPCWNPAHLFVGTQAENMEDMKTKHRTKRGSEKKLAKLTEKEVAEIRTLFPATNKTELAKKYRVSRKTIRDLLDWKTWKYVNPPKEARQ